MAEAVAGKNLLRVMPWLAPHVQSLRFDVVDVEVVTCSFEAVGVLSGIGVGRTKDKWSRPCVPSTLEIGGKQGPRFGVETFVRDKPPRDCADRARQKKTGTDGPDGNAAEVRRGSVQRCHGS